MADNPNSNRGFAAMDPERQKDLASYGGRMAHEKGTAHEFTSDEAREAGRRGGVTVSQNREHMAEIGRRGGNARAQRRRFREVERTQSVVINEGTESDLGDDRGAEGSGAFGGEDEDMEQAA